jgi:acyl-CoA reductase-like NAD-dependent aldehyde dehydrogenase
MLYSKPNTENAVVNFKEKYANFIGGQWVDPVFGNYFTNTSPVNNEVICQIPASTKEDILK